MNEAISKEREAYDEIMQIVRDCGLVYVNNPGGVAIHPPGRHEDACQLAGYSNVADRITLLRWVTSNNLWRCGYTGLKNDLAHERWERYWRRRIDLAPPTSAEVEATLYDLDSDDYYCRHSGQVYEIRAYIQRLEAEIAVLRSERAQISPTPPTDGSGA